MLDHDCKELTRGDAALAAQQAHPATPASEGVFFGATQQGGGDDAEGDNEEEPLFDAVLKGEEFCNVFISFADFCPLM